MLAATRTRDYDAAGPLTPAHRRGAGTTDSHHGRGASMSRRLSLVLLVLFVTAIAVPAHAANKALFDNAHAETAGNADWVIDNDQPSPIPAQGGITPGTSETYWTGAVSAWRVAR